MLKRFGKFLLDPADVCAVTLSRPDLAVGPGLTPYFGVLLASGQTLTIDAPAAEALLDHLAASRSVVLGPDECDRVLKAFRNLLDRPNSSLKESLMPDLIKLIHKSIHVT